MEASGKFQIEGINRQDEYRVAFQAREVATGRWVELIRFLPFGKKGDGLSLENRGIFESRMQRLSGVDHPGLRQVIGSGCDRVDGMPYVVFECRSGQSLLSVLQGGRLSVEDTRDLLARALEVSEMISAAVGVDDIWVETDPREILVTESDGVLFSMSALKLGGVVGRHSGLECLADLVERLRDWQGRLVGDQTGEGLGAWVRWARVNPKASVHGAREQLLGRTVDDAAGLRSRTERTGSTSPPAVRRPQTGVFAWIGAGAAVLLVLGGGWWGLNWTGANRTVEAFSPMDTTTEAADFAVGPRPRKSPAAADLTMEELATRGNPAALPPVTANVESDAPVEVEPEVQVLVGEDQDASPTANVFDSRQQEEIMRRFREEVTVEGVLGQVRLAGNRRIWYLEFSKTNPQDHVRAMLYVKDGIREITRVDLEPLLGKRVRIRGKVDRERIGKVSHPKLLMDGMDGITVVGQ